jgi:hypothetical protein
MRPPENPEIAANLALALRPRGADKGPRVPRARYDLRMLSRIPDEVLGEIDGGEMGGLAAPCAPATGPDWAITTDARQSHYQR